MPWDLHLTLAHFGNCGMRSSLADNLNLTGTARYNLSIQHKLQLTTLTLQNPQRKKIPAAFESIISFFNHLELEYVNRMAINAGISLDDIPFRWVEPLPPDNGERFSSEYLTWMRATKPQYDLQQSQCLCKLCGTATKIVPQQHRQKEQPMEPMVREANHHTTVNNVTAIGEHEKQNSAHPEKQVAGNHMLPQTQLQPQQQGHEHQQQQMPVMVDPWQTHQQYQLTTHDVGLSSTNSTTISSLDDGYSLPMSIADANSSVLL